jgi:hypothetical protein
MTLERSLLGMRNTVVSQPLSVFEAFSADNARIIFRYVNISAMFPEEIRSFEFDAASAANAALCLGGKLPLFCIRHRSGN